MKTCSFSICDKKLKAKGLCSTHYKQQLRGENLYLLPRIKLCSMPNCGEKVKALGFCSMHHARKRFGRPMDAPKGLPIGRPGRKGPASPSWKGGITDSEVGRKIWIADEDPMFSMAIGKTNYVLEHRLVVARWLKRPLFEDETVHHIDGNNLNNEFTNLQLRTGHHGEGQVRKCADCGSRNIICEEI